MALAFLSRREPQDQICRVHLANVAAGFAPLRLPVWLEASPREPTPRLLITSVDDVDSVTLERGLARETVTTEMAGVFFLGQQWPPCECPICKADPAWAAQVAECERAV